MQRVNAAGSLTRPTAWTCQVSGLDVCQRRFRREVLRTMTEFMQRLKPDPIPRIHPVPKFLADGRLKAVYEDTKAALHVPWMGVVTMAFAHYPTFYGTLWDGLRDLCGSAEFDTACANLRAHAEEAALLVSPPDLQNELRGLGYADAELDEIRDLSEVFSHGNMPYLLIASLARLLLEGHELSAAREAQAHEARHGPSSENRLVLMEPHHAGADTRGVYKDVRERLGLPFVNTDYRALARWPTYFAMAWGELRPHIDAPIYWAATENIHRFAVETALALPNPGGLTADALRQAAEADAAADEVLQTVRLFQWLLPGLVLNVAFFRAQLLAGG